MTTTDAPTRPQPEINPQHAVPCKPAHPELLRAAEILRERGIRKEGYGDYGEQRCSVGALMEACGHEFYRPQYQQVCERYTVCYDVLLEAIGGEEMTVEEFSDGVVKSWSAAGPAGAAKAAEEMADFLERAAYQT